MVKKAVVIAGNRHRKVGEAEWETVRELLANYKPSEYYVLLCNGDLAFGTLVHTVATGAGFFTYEFIAKSHNEGPNYLWELLHMGRHAALTDLGDDYHLFLARGRFNTIEDLVERVKRGNKPYKLYDHECAVVEQRLRPPGAAEGGDTTQAGTTATTEDGTTGRPASASEVQDGGGSGSGQVPTHEGK